MRPERDVVLGYRYELVERLAVGATGEVWEARDTALGRPVAVKILEPELRNASTFLARFRAEARHAGGVGHPGIATVYDYGETSDLAFLVVELVRGQPLSELMTDQLALPVSAKLSILSQTAEALGAAHDAGIVHRDVKPGNLMVRRDGTVKVTDFGIACAQSSASLTETGQMIGTPTYRSPEQAVGDHVSGASDVYSLGVVAYEMFAGHPPFERDTPLAIAFAHVNDAPPPLPETVPPRVAELIESALAKDPSLRPTTASFAAQLRQEMAATQTAHTGDLQQDEHASNRSSAWPSPVGPPVARPTSVPAPVATHRGHRRRPSLAVGAFIGLLALIGATMWWATRSSPSGEAETDPRAASNTSGAIVEERMPPPTRPPATVLPATVPSATVPLATVPLATVPTAIDPPATLPPTTQSAPNPAPATVTPPATGSAPPTPAAAGVSETDAVAFIVDYYGRLAAGDYDTGWESLSSEFRDARNLTFERYVAYWQSTALALGDVRFVPGPAVDEGSVRFEARYTTDGRVVDETDEITLHRESDGRLTITQQRIV